MALRTAFVLAMVMCITQARPEGPILLEDNLESRDFSEPMFELFFSDIMRTIDSFLKPYMEEIEERASSALKDGHSVFVFQRMNDQDQEEEYSLPSDKIRIEKYYNGEENPLGEENSEDSETLHYDEPNKYEETHRYEETPLFEDAPKYEETNKDEEIPQYVTIEFESPGSCDLGVSPIEA